MIEIKADALKNAVLTKSQLGETLNQSIGLSKTDSLKLIDAFFDVISEALIEGQTVKLMHLGTFEVRQKNSRPGRNPATGEVHNISARRVVSFHASESFKERLNPQDHEAVQVIADDDDTL